jgi:hypothetical protein
VLRRHVVERCLLTWPILFLDPIDALCHGVASFVPIRQKNRVTRR